jgi:hypothetical protein
MLHIAFSSRDAVERILTTALDSISGFLTRMAGNRVA